MALSGGKSSSAEATSYLVNHIALPPQLPQDNDFNSEHERCLLNTTLDALRALKTFATAQHDGSLNHAILTIKNFMCSKDDLSNVSEIGLRKLLYELANGQNTGSIPLEIKAQNAGILITSDGERITFEFFELSPDNKSAMAKGRLIRTFPGLAASIPVIKMKDQSLQHMLADTLAKMSTQAAPGFQPQAYKAGRDHDEDRDTTHPGMVTDYLPHIIAALGETTSVTRITKNTREEVLWSNCKTPWRRSPVWLLVRVTLQLLFTRQDSLGPAAESLYKIFMVQLLSLIQERAQNDWQLLGSGPLYVLNAKMLQRLRKLESQSQLHFVKPSWMEAVKACMLKAYKLTDQKWSSEVQSASANLNTTRLKFLQPEAALDMQLPELDKFLVDVHSRKTAAADSNFKPGPSYPTFIEAYVGQRERSASNKVSIFRDFGNVSSFAVQYFNQSKQLQDVMKRIQQDAAAKRAAKCKELADMKLQHKNLMQRHNSTECEYVTVITNRYHGYTKTVHDRYCNRCDLKNQADGLNIDIYEWPLPSEEATAKATVFELKIPQTYRIWRDLSVFVISNVLGCKSNAVRRPQFQYVLSGHRDLSQMLDSQYHSRRIVPLSEIKPHVVTHRKNKKAVQHLQEEDVCLKNALRYGYYDTSMGTWTAQQMPSGRLSQTCMYEMPARSEALNRFLSKPPSAPDGVPPNEVIASLSDCPPHFSIEEYKAFGSLPLGRNIFYSNIMTQLAMPTVDFSKLETQCLILQTTTQVGIAADNAERTSHSVLLDPTFASAFIAQLEVAAQRVEENWESWRALATFVQLACRTVNLTTTPEVRTRCLRFLHKARQIAIVWLHRLKTRAAASTNEEQRTELFFRATEIALLAFEPASNAAWEVLAAPHQHWLHVTSGNLPVHINLLTGELLVNGLPLSRLPSEYLSHPIYKPLFSSSALEVVPTDEPGMRFSAKASYNDHELHFGMASGDMLVVGICEGMKFDLVPARVFADQMPHAFLKSFIHWYNQKSGDIHFRPREQPWQLSGDDHWLLRRHGLTWRLHRGSQTLLNMKSKAARALASLFKSVEDAPHMHIFYDTVSDSTEIELPRLSLDFRLTRGDKQVHSRQYRGMILDTDQKIETLVGLTSMLVLRRNTHANERLVLIPEGTVSYGRTFTHHISVTIGRQESTTVHAYQLDKTLGRILDSGAMQSKLLLCFLHALTSHLLPDPLTGRTGTESALTILRSSAVRSFDALSLENLVLLNEIAGLSPAREYYPRHERVMQTVGWNPRIPFQAQHGDFQVLVKEIFQQEKKMALFHMDIVRAFAACYRSPELAALQVPAKPIFQLSQGSTFNKSEVQSAAKTHTRSFDDSSEAQLPRQKPETEDEHLRRIERLFQDQTDRAVQDFAASLHAQWPRENPSTPASSHLKNYVNVTSAMDIVRPRFQMWYDNRNFERYVSMLSRILEGLPTAGIVLPNFDAKALPKKKSPGPDNRHCNSAAVVSSSPPVIALDAPDDSSFLVAPREPKLDVAPKSTLTDEVEAGGRLRDLCQTLNACAKTSCEKSYVDALRVSCDSLDKHKEGKDVQSFLIDERAQNSLRNYLSDCEDHFQRFNSKLRGVLEAGSSLSNVIASLVQLSPRQPPSYWLSWLNRDQYDTLPSPWSNVIIEYGLAITNLHRAQRLVALLDKPVELNEELQHVGHTNWDAREFPETLLLEAESGILVRKVQAMIATEMMEPKDDQNTVMQLNMGEGKSSTIVPLVAAALADKKK
ncbi:hypothetical protein N0V86_003940 [Didymella sp. IMI 355093]|nr:hypothetical protein N0V86_003940 [Didymella sp. IMI 355093]